MKISVIIPTRNREKMLESTLNSISKQSLDQRLYEVIVCDNNSTDSTSEVANLFSNKFVNFRYIKTYEPGLHVGRNKGYQVAKSDILVFADDDIEAFPDWLLTIDKVFSDDKVMLVGGKNLPKWEINPPEWALKMWEPNEKEERIVGAFSLIDLGDEMKEIGPYFVFGCNFSIRKQILNECKGFHPDGMPQEIIEYRGDGETFVSEYIKQKKYKVIYHPDASVYHFVSRGRLTLNYLRQRSFNQGVSDSYSHIRQGNDSGQSYKNTLRSLIRKLLQKIIKISHFVKRDINNKAVDYQQEMETGYLEGYSFHQKMVKNNPKLKDWVMKEDYL
jgi:glycosyltransferase involved in cell wall biosynthesis